MKFLGVEFAPLWLPVERRLQTAALAIHMGFFFPLSAITLATMLYLFIYTSYQWIPLLYLCWMVHDWNVGERGGRTNKFVRGWRFWRYFRDYFPISIVKTAELDPDQSYLVGIHPHGILCFGAFCCMATDASDFSQLYPGISTTLITLPEQFWLPGSRELVAAAGLCSSSKSSMELLLREREKGHATVLVVGGAAEALNHGPDEIRLVLNRRKGFIKLALRFGRPLVPAFVFGENDLFAQADNPEGSLLRRFQEWFETITAFTPPVFYGRGIFQYSLGLVPRRLPLTVVMGAPIPVEKTPMPTSEQILGLHATYVEALQKLYEEHNPKYGDPKVKLVVA